MTIYTLTDFQYGVLQGANENTAPAIITEPNPMGTLEERRLVNDYLAQLQGLVELGFLKETTSDDQNKAGIDACIEKFGYGYRVFHISEQGKMMFNKKNLVVN